MNKISKMFNLAGLEAHDIQLKNIKINTILKSELFRLKESDRLEFYNFIHEKLLMQTEEIDRLVKNLKLSAIENGTKYTGHFKTQEDLESAKNRMVNLEIKKIMDWFDKNIKKNNAEPAI